MGKELDIDDELYQEGVAESQHKELVDLLKQLILSMKKDDYSSRISLALENNASVLNAVISKIGEITKPNADQREPSVTVNTNQDLVVNGLQELAKDLKESFQQLAETISRKNPTYVLDFKRDQYEKFILSPITATPNYNG